jgi:hypothetical protein
VKELLKQAEGVKEPLPHALVEGHADEENVMLLHTLALNEADTVGVTLGVAQPLCDKDVVNELV